MSKREIKVGARFIGDGHPVFVIGEIGINHNGDIEIAKKIIAGAKHAGCDCLLYTSPSPRDRTRSRMPSSA